ncbi:amino acid adenylation [Zopfia rhizophila CBS 207.26]|uniref:Amino acid adenylation n=1 Tax=Zopfia rhizophila CBS 207.26 TaxID=1314779 RepID=A0A6A6DQJ8_9PEZI|nr:amino acid adenylation [Zopfia rhizophila CBS 207.26]
MGSVSESTAAVWLWNDEVPTRVEECAHELIHKQVKLRPNALAVDAHDGTWTYAELDEASNRVAHFLVGLGIRPEDIVPLCFEKSRWAIVGILGVLKSGAAMVFLDPSHPESRRQYITTEVEAKVIICSPPQAHLYEANFPPTFALSKDTLETLPHYDAAPKTTVRPSNLLYIIFTSGSTGTPKGCLIEHRAFCSGSIRHAERARIISSSRVLQLASYTFDVSILEILTSLIHGACICTPDMAMMANGPAHIVNEYKITWTFMTPSLVKLMAPSMVPTLETLALGGEPLSKIDVETWAGHVQLVNGYGPSECSIAATGNTEMTPQTDPANIGYPVGGICWVVDAEDHDVLLPPNEVGELLIEGPILARGYLKNKEKTDEVFVSRPAWGPTTKSGEDRRFYKTGDLAKYLPDGSIYFIGRKDTQVKLRGLRIELGEIEHHIGVHPQVRHRMVILPKSGLFANRLVALVSLVDFLTESSKSVESSVHVLEDMHREDIQGHLQSIRETLKANVPEYMVPETWVVLERFPLLISGKLNRSLVSKWILEADNNLYRQVVGLDFEEVPAAEDSDSVEEQLRSIISAVLNLPLENISLQKSFLSLGGDSITAMQVMARCRGAGLAVSVKDILRSKSITELSYCVRSPSETAYSTEEKFDVPFELSPVQRMYFDIAPPEIDDSRQTRFNQSFFLKVERPVSGPSLAKALELVVTQHSMLRVRFLQEESGKWMQVIPSQVDDSFSFSIHSIDTEKDAYPIMAATQASLDTRKGPIFSVALFNTPSQGQYLFLVAHHVMIDLVSWRVILRDLEEILTTGLLTAERPLPFQNWLALQSGHGSKTDISRALPYDIPSPDFDYWGMSGKPNRMCDTQEAAFTLDIATTKELLEGACHSAFNTEPIDLLLASLVYSFNQIFSDRSVPALFREGHGREPWDEDIDISGTVGWFTTMYPLYIDMKDEFSMLDVVRRAKDVRHSVPDNGRPYFASRYLSEAGKAKFGDHDHVELSFDYLGLYQQMERPDALLTQVPGYQAIFEDIGGEAPRFALIEITAEVLQGQMQLLFVFNKNMKNQDFIQSWIKNCKLCLINGLEQLQNRQQELTLADFPLLRLNYEDLNTLVHAKLPEIGISSFEQVESVYPSSPMQHGLLISQVRSESQGAYEYNHTLKVETRNSDDILNVETLSAAWSKVVQRHPSLRTVFIESVSQAGLYDQVVLRSIDPKIHIQKCKEDEVDRVFSSQGRLAFQPGGSLHRFTICHVSASMAICKLEINHAIIDGSSITNLVGDFILAYDGRISNRNGFAFEDYIKHVLERPINLATDFWIEYLADVNPSFFPLMAHWEDAVDPQRRLQTVTIDVGMTPSDLTDFCNDKNVTLVNIFQFAWGLVLRNYIGSDDVCFGYLSSGRDAPLNGQHCGLAEIHHALKLGSQPLFNTIISFHRESDHELLTDSSVKVEALRGHDPTEYALSLDVGVTESKINVTLQFWTSDFTLAQAQNIGATLAEAVRSTIRDSEKAIGKVDLVSAEHLDQLRKITAVYPQYTEECVHHAIEAQVLSTPDAEAICSYEGSWTYKELDDQATRLAHHLVSLGVGPEVIVPYCFQKSAWAIISMIAILKAGGAGVALDPEHPVNRLEGLIEQTGSRIILAAPRNVHLFASTSNVEHVVGVSLELINKLEPRSSIPCPAVTPSNACFVVFTSGTTGKPKGIILEHRNLRTLCTSMGEVLGFGSETRALQFAAYNFDVSLQDILTSLQMGGTICVISDEERMNDLAGGINARGATWADITATVIGMLKPSEVPCMKRLNNGGEPLNRDVVETWADHVEFYNLYGPAETTVNQTASVRLSKTSPATNIGPAYGTHVWIVNDQDHNRLVPLGCAGEILIEGPMLARGYLKDPVKTAAAFIENPAWVSSFPNPAAVLPRRFYKSGDLGILNTDGSITIVGRRDTQVKINGQRVELDEIMYQTQLVLPEGYQAVIDAIAIEEHTKSKTIIGYITSPEFSKTRQSEDQTTIEIDDRLRRLLKDLQVSLSKALPFYMIPSLFVPVFNIPYTTSGKLDRTKLRQTVSGFSKSQISHYMLRSTSNDQPRTPIEQLLQDLFSKILSIEAETISRDDNFFGLGGDSVGAMKMVAAARKQNVTIRVADIFKYPNLGELAAVVKDGEVSAARTVAPFSLLGGLQLDKAVAEAAAQCNLTPADIEDIYPTSALQEGMMALGMRKEGAYIAQKVFRLPLVNFDFPLFQSAWAKVIETEAILRTRIVSSSSGNLQVVNKQPLSWHQANGLEAYLAKDNATAFQYGEPLMRLATVNEANSAAYFIWTAHHAIYDGWSVSLLFEKVVHAYQGQSIISSTPFKSFIGRLNEVSQSSCIDFWKDQFSTQGSFPTSFPVVGLGYAATSKKTISLQASASTAPSNILDSTIKRAAWAMTLAMCTDSEDVVFAQTLSGRNISLAGIDNMMGPTITTVPVRVSAPKSGITVKQFLEAVQSQSISSIDYEHFGLQNIRDVNSEARTTVDSITNLFVLQPSDNLNGAFLGMESVPRPEDNFDTYPLVVICNLGSGGKFSIDAMYDEEVIPTEQMNRMLHQYEHFVQELSGDFNRSMEEISLLNKYDFKDVTAWNTELPSSIDARIPDLVLQNVATRPDAEAVSAWDGSVTYRELDQLTSKLANHLLSLGVGPEVKVGLCFDKSMWNIISMFAVMRTGGVCVQLLPNYPMPRMLSILDDIEASVVLVSPQHAGLFDGVIPNILSIEQSFVDALPQYYNTFRAPQYGPENAAFIVFTSGSTGKPKGVIIEHRGFCTMTHYQLPKILLNPDSRVLQFATHTFDICLFESFAPLVKGACVCVPSEYDRMNNLVGAINTLNVDWIIMVSTVADTFHPDDVPSLKSIILGGEPLRADIHARWAPRVNLFNDYGPAECSILAVMTRSTLETPPSMIGKGQGGRTWIVDKADHNRLVPVGCIGELLVEGPLLARGYLKNPEKTAESYINSPTWASSIQPHPTRLYKTGDLVRYTNDGNMLCLGRKDTQIKIRGLRVELGEIEHHVKTSSFGTQKQAVEKILLGGDVEKAALAAFVVPSAEDITNDESEVLALSAELNAKFLKLRDHIAQSLQAYMVPSLYIPLRRMPETQTNKIDRNALKRVGAALTPEQIEIYSLGIEEDAASKRAPSTLMETALQSLWAQLLRIDFASIGADDSFFSKGGDSIKAMRLTSMARSEGIKLIVADIFKNPVLCDMAAIAVLEDSAASVDGPVAPFALAPTDNNLISDASMQCAVSEDMVEDIYPCAPLQEGLMELATQHESAYTAQRVFRIQEEIDIQSFKNAWAQLVALHPILRTRIVLSKTSGAMQVVLKEGISWQNETTLSEYLASDKTVAIKYGSPLARYALDSEHRHFIWTVHHALYDGHSANILMEQLEALYSGSRVDVAPGYNKFIKLINEVDAHECKAFWTKQLTQGSPNSFPTLPSATYQPSPDSEVTRAFEVARNADQGYMISTILRAAWAIVTGRYMGSDDIAFAATNSGRNAPIQDIESIVGPTITTVPIQLQINSASTVAEFLARVQRQSTEMIPFEHAGIQNIYAMAGEKQNLKNLFVIQQPLGDLQQSTILNEILDKGLLRGFHTYAAVVECMIMSENKINVELQFDHKALPEASARRVLDQFEYVVHQLISVSSSTVLDDIALVTPKHVQQMVEWNNMVDIQNVEDCVHNIFREQVKLRPDAQAITSWDGSLTYKQLDQLTDRLAAYLAEKGVNPEYLVPMCFDKSMWTIVAMMSTLKAGGACVHLGRNSPIARMAEIIQQASASIVLTDSIHKHKFEGVVEAIVIDQSLLMRLGSTSPLPQVSPTNPAFVLFTSGSTGKPKGVVVEHGSLCTSSRAHGTNRKVGPHTRLLQFAAYTFDVSVADIFTTLQRGGCICIPSEDERINDLPGAINRTNVNYGFLTPTVAGMLDPKTVPGLKRLILGGELLTQDNVQRWASVVDLIISYGMTECSIHCVDAVPLTLESDPANLGRPSGCYMWIVDREDHNKLAPIGAVGELVIEGRMVSRGYLNDKAKTDAAFITNPTWAQGTGADRRMYKTGDLVKYSAEGEICYVSRKDFQVKHHGQRIELSEIEHHLVADTRVKHAVVLLPKTGYLQKRLIAVLSLESLALPLSLETQLALISGLDKGVADVQIASVRNHLATKVPDYMVPAVFVIARALPLTPNNKMDRVTTLKWLEEMEEQVYESIIGGGEEEDGAPATVQQKRLHDLLTGVLGLPSINMNRSFLDLGGDSITAMQLRAKGQAAGISLTVRDILTCESISHLVVEAKFLSEEGAGFEEITGQPFPLTAWQQTLIESYGENQTLLIRLALSTTVPKLVRAIEALVQQHSMLRARFTHDSQGQWSQIITKELAGSYKFEAHAVLTSADINTFLSNMEPELDIENGPLFTVRLFDLTEESNQQVMAITIHPLIADTTSMRIVVQDLRELLQGSLISSKKALPFQSWLVQGNPVVNGQTYDFDLRSWGIKDSANTTENIVEKSITLPSGITSLLLGASNNALSTQPADILVAVLAKAWSDALEGQPSIAVKEETRISRTVGQFNRIRQLPKTDSQDFIQLLSEVKDARARHEANLSLAQPLPRCVEMLVESIDYTTFGNEEALTRPQFEVPSAVLTVSSIVRNGETTIKFRYSAEIAHQDSLAGLVAITQQSIPKVTSNLATMTRKPTLSDFPLLSMEYSQLAGLENALLDLHVPFSNVEAIVPCTPLQQRMLNSQKQTPGSYQSDTAHKITPGGNASIDIARIQDSWRKVTARHEALRTVFIPSITRPGESDQLVLKTYTPTVDVIQCDESNINRIIENHHTVSHSSFKPHVGFTVFETRSAFYCKLEISHALQDGMSTRIIYQDLVLAYQDMLPEGTALGFREYVSWLANQDLAPSNEFWTKYLSVIKPCHIPRSSKGYSKGDNVLVPINIDASAEAITQLCRKHKITSATLFQAAWILVLRTFSGSDDVLFGYITANRELDIAGLDNIVGPMINMLACRMNVASDNTSLDLLKNTHESFLENLDYQHGFVAAANAKEVRDGVLPWNSVLSIEYASEESGNGYYPSSSEKSGSSSPLNFDALYGTRAPEFDVVLGVLLGETSLELQLGYWDGIMDEGMMKEIVKMYKAVVEEWVKGEDLSGSIEKIGASSKA